MPCSRSADSPSTSSAKSILSPCVPWRLLSLSQRVELVVEDLLALVEQPPDQRRLAVIDAAAGDEAQQLLRLLLREPGADVVADQLFFGLERTGHQKYPSCFFFSIDALPRSLSMIRPCRSEVLVSSISATISSTVAASLSTAPDKG